MRLIFACFAIFLWVLPLHAQPENTFSLSGQLRQGTPDGDPLPDSLALWLKILDENGQTVGVKQSFSQADYSFRFDNLPAYPQHFYVVTANWAGIEQTTTPLTLDLLPETLDFPLYEVSPDLADVVAYRGNMRLEWTELSRLGVQILFELSYTNLGERIVWNSALGHSLQIELPVGAFGFAAEVPSESAAQRYQFVDQSTIPLLKDSLPMLPNFPNVMRISFFVPYQDGAIIDLRLPLALDDFRVFMRDDQITLTSAGLRLAQETETSSGRVYQVYEQVAPYQPQQAIEFTLLGAAASTQVNLPPPDPPASSQFIILLGVLVISAFAGLMLWLTRRINKP